jgi:signal peptide peptidase SppA
MGECRIGVRIVNYELAQLLGERGWVIDPKVFHRAIVPMIKRTEAATPQAIEAAMAAYAQRDTGPQMVGDVAVIKISGPITYKSSWFTQFFGATAIEDLQAQFRTALGDPAVRTIVFQVNSPGGVIDMVPEFADEVFAARGQKPIVAVADTLVASAAYWIASQADTIYATTSSQLGSIGVYCEHDDISGLLEKSGITITLIAHGDHKTEGNPYEPLSDEARARFKAEVDEIGDWFDTAVARGRRVQKLTVLRSFGQGLVFRGQQAIALGLADKKGTIHDLLRRSAPMMGRGSASRALIAEEHAAIIAALGDQW